ncbi:DUF4189 domain-containing protein, partial [Wohlfahrtiimonas populi]|uniref:DUF4189 domain-containing protein n=1 Tax=Wohlfahrtiimonas populi TaxID=1940240 RepID=UPI00117F02A8
MPDRLGTGGTNSAPGCIKKHNGIKSNCVLVRSFYNSCISLYMGNNTKGGWGIDAMYTHNARARGAQACKEQGGTGCKEILTFCT